MAWPRPVWPVDNCPKQQFYLASLFQAVERKVFVIRLFALGHKSYTWWLFVIWHIYIKVCTNSIPWNICDDEMGKNDDYNPLHHGIFLNAEWCDSVTQYTTMRNNLNCERRGSRLISQLHCCFLAPLCTKTNGWWSRPKFQKMALTSKRCNNSWTGAQGLKSWNLETQWQDLASAYWNLSKDEFHFIFT